MVRLKLVWCLAALLLAVVAFGGSAATTARAEAEAKSSAAETEHAKAAGEVEGKTAPHPGDVHEDPYDNNHANSSKKINDPDEIKGDSTIATFVIFLLVLAILTKFAWKPIAHGLEAREKGIEAKIEQARLAAEKATEQLREYELRLAAATQEAQQIVGEARKTAETAKEKILGEAQALAQREREKAVADITVAKNQALREIAEKSVDTAIGLARNIIRREVRPGDHEQLIQDALKQFPNN